MKLSHASHRFAGSERALVPAAILGCCLWLAACEEPQPRTFADFMEDPIARDGTIARCNEDREATLHDIECANARRAMSAIALREERERREAAEAASEIKLEQLRRRLDEADERARQAATEAILAQQEAYEKLWRERLGETPVDADSAIAAAAVAGSDTAAMDAGVALAGSGVPDDAVPDSLQSAAPRD